MQKLLHDKKTSGIFWAIVILIVFVAVSLWGTEVFRGTSWFLFSSIIRFLFGFLILFIAKKLYDTPIRNVLSMKGTKQALFAGSGFLLFLIYYLILWCSGIKSITGLSIGLLISRILLQQIATGFYEELNFRFLVLEGYFYSTQNVKNKLMYSFLSFLLFGALHVVDGWSIYRFLQTGTIGFAFAVMYLQSRNIVLPMILHFIYDIFANLAGYIEWNNSTLFVHMNSKYGIMLIVLYVISFIMLLIKSENNKENMTI